MNLLNVHKGIGTFFGSGYFPKGPGTAGAALATGIWYLLYCGNINWTIDKINIQIGVIIFATLVGTWSTKALQKEWGKDPSKIVIDEAIGVWISLCYVPCQWQYVLAAFLLFRFFDILKPLGIKSMENIGGAFGVILDDILAGVYARLVMCVLVYYSLFG